MRRKEYFTLFLSSQQLTDGLKAMIEDIVGQRNSHSFSLGGTAGRRIRSDPTKIVEAVNQSPDAEQILVFADLGSAVLNAELAYDMLEPEQQTRYHLIDAPLCRRVLLAAAITAGFSDDLSQITAEAQKAAEKGWNQ